MADTAETTAGPGMTAGEFVKWCRQQAECGGYCATYARDLGQVAEGLQLLYLSQLYATVADYVEGGGAYPPIQ